MIGLTLDVFRNGRAAKGISLFTVCMFTFVFYLSPTGAAVAKEVGKDDEKSRHIEQQLESTPEKKLTHRLQKLQQKLARELPESRAQREQSRSWLERMLEKLGLGGAPLSADELAELSELTEQVREAYAEAILLLEQEDRPFKKSKKLPQSAKRLVDERHANTLNTVKQKYQKFDDKLRRLTASDSADEQEEILNELADEISEEQFKPTHTPVDPQNLPWRSPSEQVREPKLSKGEIQLALGIDPLEGYTQIASTVLTPDMLNPMGQPTDADLAETLDANLTEEIKALAASLNNNPVEIYTWVHNNIRFIPSYGSIQGAQYTLETGKGNAVDTASLLIALLRAAGIPARYAYGTVEVPVDNVMNWVGGVTAPEAAQSLLGQGGIPNVALIQGGAIKSIRLEHTWVEAWVDFEPSRGLKNREGDRWIPMDASFKQYEFTQDMNLTKAVPFDAEGLVTQIEQNATVNEEQGWIQNVPQAEIENSLQEFQSQLEAYINNQNPDATVGDVLGLQEVKILPPRPLAAGLPYEHIVTQQSFTKVPASLQHRFKYELASQNSGYPGSPFISINEPTVKLAGKKLALSFRTATEDDQAIIESYIPEPDPETGEIDPNAIPDTLPGYLIHLVADFSIDGVTKQSGGNQTMGTELHETLGLYSPSHGWGVSNNHPIAGEYRAIGLDLQGISPTQAAKLKTNLETTKQKLESGDDNQLLTLTKHDVIGDLIYGTIMSYFALNDVQEEIQAQSADMVTYRLPSYGIFSTSLQPQYWYGIPRNTSFSGLNMDVDRVMFHGAAKDNSKETRIAFTKANGSRLSAMEHLVPEQMFSTPDAPAHGISAVKALAIAAAEGQRIWTITKENLDLALDNTNLGTEVENEIRNSVLAGNVATAHENRLNYHGWVGSGYLLVDPSTGAGAYKISGGANGGELVLSVVQGLLNFLGFSVDVAGLVNALAGGPFGAFLKGLAKALTTLTFVVGVIDIASNERCSVFSARYLILVQTVFSVLLIAAAAGAALLALPIIFTFLLLLAASYAAGQALEHAENLVCDE